MPVIDHPVHDRTKIDTRTFRYGCHNRGPMAPSYLAPHGYARQCWKRTPDGGRVEFVQLKPIQHAMSTACRSFRLWGVDPACDGCTAPRDYEYARSYGYKTIWLVTVDKGK